MEEIVIKLDVPEEMKSLVEESLRKIVDRLVLDLEFSMADKILSKSELTDEQIKEMVDSAKIKEAKELGLL